MNFNKFEDVKLIFMNEQNSSAGSSLEGQRVSEPTVVYQPQETLEPTKARRLEEEMRHVWQGLSDEQKRLLIDVMKEMLRHRKPDNIPQEEWEEMMNQRAGFLAGAAKTYTREEAREILTHKDKRHEFLHRHK